MTELSVLLLGSFSASLRGEPLLQFRTKKVQALLIYLVAEGISAHTRESLMTLLWPDMPEKSARTNLRQVLYQLRKAIPELNSVSGNGITVPFLVSRGQFVQVNPDAAVELDVDRFTRHLEATEVHSHFELQTCLECKSRLIKMVGLYNGAFLEDVYLEDSNLFEEWVHSRREYYRRQVLYALDTLTSICMRQGDFPRAEAYARRMLQLDNLHEGAHRKMIRMYAHTQQRTAALRHYESFRELLRKELGTDPDEATTVLYDSLMNGLWKPEYLQKTEDFAQSIQDNKNPVRGAEPIELSLPTYLSEDRDPDPDSQHFVERDEELERLHNNLSAAKSRHGKIMFVVGGPGRGKSTLMREFIRRSQADDEDLLVVCGYCHAITRMGDPYLPFRQVLNLLTGDVEAAFMGGLISHDQAVRLWKLMPVSLPALVRFAPDLVDNLVPASALLERSRSWASATDWYRSLETSMPDSHRSGLDQKQIFAQFAAFFNQIARHVPLLVLIEDLHWVDPASSSLLFHLSQELAGKRIFLVGTYRPEEIAQDRPVGSSSGVAARHVLLDITYEMKRQHGDIWIDLAGYDADARRRFVDSYLDTLPNHLGESFRKSLLLRTEGHPLFTVELVRSMQERGDLQKGDSGQWIVGESIDWSALPAKVEGAIESRIERLSEELQTVLSIACVEGETFTAEVVARIQGRPVQELIRQLSKELDKKHRLISPRTIEWIGPARQQLSIYRFRHQLFQDYLYQHLDGAERRYLHGAVGRALEQLHEGRQKLIATQLAWHFEAAGDLTSAIDYRRESGETAAAVFAYDEAAAHFTRAVALADTVGLNAKGRADLHIRLGKVLLVVKGDGAAEVGEAYRRAYELYQETSESVQLFSALRGLAMHSKFHGALDQAFEWTQEMVTLAQDLRDPVFIVESSFAMGSLYYFAGEHARAHEHLEVGIRNYSPERYRAPGLFEDQDPGVALLCYISVNLWFLGYPDQAVQKGYEALALAEELDHPYNLAMAHIWVGWIFLLRRENEKALAHSRTAIGLAERHDFPLFAGVGRLQEGRAMADGGNAASLIPNLKEAIETIGKTMGSEVAGGLHISQYVDVLVKGGMPKEAKQMVNQAIAHTKIHSYTLFNSELYRLRGELNLLSDSSEEAAQQDFLTAIDICRHQSARSPELWAVMSLARLWMAQGRREEAARRLGDALGWFTEGWDTPDLVEAGNLLEALSGGNSPPSC